MEMWKSQKPVDVTIPHCLEQVCVPSTGNKHTERLQVLSLGTVVVKSNGADGGSAETLFEVASSQCPLCQQRWLPIVTKGWSVYLC